MKLKVTNPTIQADYGEWELKDLIKALSNPFEHPQAETAARMRFDLSGDEPELEFEIIGVKKNDSIPIVSDRSLAIQAIEEMSRTETISTQIPEATKRLADERVLGTVGRPLLRYHGGKWILAPWIIKHFPSNHRVYCEPFGGAASVLLQKRPCYAEIYNDLDGEIVNLFCIVRERGSELSEALKYTPFSRIEFELSYQPTEDDFERARRTVVRSFMGFGSASSSGRKTGFRSNSNRSGTTPAHDWKNYPDAMQGIIDRLRGVVIENRDAKQVMASCDGLDTLHYVDPPYVLDTRYNGQKTKCYNHEMTDDEHIDLCEFLKQLRGTVVVSGYDHELYNDILKGWHKHTRKAYADGAKERTEVLWINRKENAGQIGLFQ